MDGEKETIVVLCHTIFHNAFRSGSFEESEGSEPLEKHLRARFISDFIIVMSSELSDGEYFATTLQEPFDEFKEKYYRDYEPESINEYIDLLENIIFRVTLDNLGTKNDTEALIIMADILSNRGNYKPILITDMKDRITTTAKDFYEKYTGDTEPDIPFSILSSKEAIIFLQGRYWEKCAFVRRFDTAYNFLF